MVETVNTERRQARRNRYGVLKDALYTILRAIGRHVKGFYGALGTFVTIILVIGTLAAAAFAAVGRLVSRGMTQSFDERVLQFFEGHRSDRLNQVMLEFTTLGSGSVLMLLVLVASVFLWLTKHQWSVYILLAGVIGGQIANAILKSSFNRPRPTVVELGTQVHSLSFPSGHAMTSMIVYGSIAYLVSRLEPTARMRAITLGCAALLVLTIGISRMYLGVHYPSDIIAGYLGGMAWLGFVVASVQALQFFAPRRPETKTEELDLNKETPVSLKA